MGNKLTGDMGYTSNWADALEISGSCIETHPIKGTRPRFADPDKEYEETLHRAAGIRFAIERWQA